MASQPLPPDAKAIRLREQPSPLKGLEKIIRGESVVDKPSIAPNIGFTATLPLIDLHQAAFDFQYPGAFHFGRGTTFHPKLSGESVEFLPPVHAYGSKTFLYLIHNKQLSFIKI